MRFTLGLFVAGPWTLESVPCVVRTFTTHLYRPAYGLILIYPSTHLAYARIWKPRRRYFFFLCGTGHPTLGPE